MSPLNCSFRLDNIRFTLPNLSLVSFVSPRPSVFAEGNIEVKEKQNPLFPVGPAIKCFVILPN